jgi:hypothetical protein
MGQPGRAQDDSTQQFRVAGLSPEEFVDAAQRVLPDLDLGARVRIGLEGDELVVRVSRLGQTELRYTLARQGGGFVARLRHQRVAPLHRAFQRHSEQVLSQILERVVGPRVGYGEAELDG